MPRRPLLALVLIVVTAGCGNASHTTAVGLRIFDPAGHVKGEVRPTDVIRSSVRTSVDQGSAVLYFRLTSRGNQRIRALTRSLAHRGARLHRVQHFAIEVSGHIYNRPFVDYRMMPDGFDGESGIEIANVPPKKVRAIAFQIREGARG
jgi:hypothetical protein